MIESAAIVVLFLVLIAGILPWPLLIKSNSLVDQVRFEKPINVLSLYLTAVIFLFCITVVVWVGQFFIVMVILALPIGAFRYPLLLGHCVLTWVSVIKLRRKIGKPDNAAFKRLAVTSFQIWMQDLIVAAFVLGFVYWMIMALNSEDSSPQVLAVILVVEILTMAPAFLIALSVLRFHKQAGRPATRALWLSFMLLVGAIPGVSFLFMLPAWFAWKLAVSRMESTELP